MLCSSRTNNRPDKQLKNHLIMLAYSLVAVSISLISLFIYPEYFMGLILSTIFFITLCLILTIKTLSSAENAMSYGGFANEIIKNDFKLKRIENSEGTAILQNTPAEEFFQQFPVLTFLEHYLTDETSNKNAFQRIKNACSNLTPEKTIISLSLHDMESKIFGNEEWFEVGVRPIYLKKSDIFSGPFSIKAIKKDAFLYWSIKNVTARQNMESIFQEERRSLHDFLDYLPIGLYICDKDSQIEYSNHALAKFLGQKREDLTGKNMDDFITQNSEIPSHHAKWHGTVYFNTANGNTEETLLYQERYKDSKNEIKSRGVVVSDIPTQGSLKNDLSLAYDKISWLFNFAPVGIIFINNEGIIQDSNTQACEFLIKNKDKNTLKQNNLFSFIQKEDEIRLQKEIRYITENYKANARLDVHLKNGEEEKVAQLYLSPMKKFYSNDISNIDGVVIYMIDATKQKSLEIQFAQAQKMQAVGQLAGGVAHDFNNLLTAMIGFCDLLLQRHGVGDPSFADLIQIKQNANRAAGLVRQLLAFSRKQPLKPKLIDVTENFMELSHMLKRILGEQIDLKFHHGTDLGFIKVDPVQFSQVIINLAVNAKDAMKGNGTLSITTHIEPLTEPYQFGSDIVQPGEFVVIDVTDTGCGIPKENLTRIFEPFFSTKQNVVGSGTGLGLAMVYGIVQQTKGFIKVDSTVGVGTTFSIYLPRIDSDSEENENNTATQEVVKSKDGTPILTVQERVQAPVTINEKLIFGLNVSSAIDRKENNGKEAEEVRILFVEDEDSVRTFAIRALKKKGYDVIGCNSAENALEQLEQDTNFDLLITDMVMPGKTGAELAAIVKEKIPNIKVILASGYSEEIAKRELSESENFEFMAKPFSLGDLTAKVFDVLNKQG